MIKIRHIMLSLIVCLLLSPEASAETITLTVEAAVEQAMKANYDINMAKERLNILKAVIGEARSGAFPQINATGSYQRNLKRPQYFFNGGAVTVGQKNSFSSSVVLTQPIYEAGKVYKALRAAGSEKRRGEADINNIKAEITLETKKIFYRILLTDKTVDITKKTLGQLKSHLNSMRRRYNEGLESDYTLMRQEVAVSNIVPELAEAEQIRIVLINALRDLLVLPPETEINLAEDLIWGHTLFGKKCVSPDDLIVSGLTNRQDLAASSARIESLKQKVAIEHSGYLPTLSATSNLTWQAQTDDYKIGGDEDYFSWTAGATLSWPIFDGFKTHYRIREAKSELKLATTEELRKKANIISEIKNTRAAFDAAVLREASQKKALALAGKAVKIAGARFNDGLVSQLELNDTILARDQAERLYAEAVFDCLVAYAELERAVGGKI